MKRYNFEPKLKHKMARDLFHQSVRQALIKEGWTITNDPYIIETDDVNFEVDLGAEKIFAAEKEGQKIAVEIKSFVATSFTYEFHRVLGQFLNYSMGMEEFDPNRKLYLAVPIKTYEDNFQLSFVKKAIRRFKIRLIIYDNVNEKIVKWKIK